jgi:hypothetical protein
MIAAIVCAVVGARVGRRLGENLGRAVEAEIARQVAHAQTKINNVNFDPQTATQPASGYYANDDDTRPDWGFVRTWDEP